MSHVRWSLSARRAWIEIKYVVKDSDFSGVALRKESVDRNGCWMALNRLSRKSLSARRAWIEIRGINCKAAETAKSLSARRAWIEIATEMAGPERPGQSLSARRAWIEIQVEHQ